MSLIVNPVNDDPVAVADSFVRDEDNALTLNPANLLGNDTDVDLDTLSVASVQGAANGAVAIDPVSYTHLTLPTTGEDETSSFADTFNNDHGGTATRRSTLPLDPVHSHPAPGHASI